MNEMSIYFEMHEVGEFIQECCEASQPHYETFKSLWAEWELWRIRNGVQVISKRALAVALTSYGFQGRTTTGNVKVRAGVRLRGASLEDIL